MGDIAPIPPITPVPLLQRIRFFKNLPPRVLKVALYTLCAAAFWWAFDNFMQVRDVKSLAFSRVMLLVMWLCASGTVGGAVWNRTQRKPWVVCVVLILGVLALGVDHIVPPPESSVPTPVPGPSPQKDNIDLTLALITTIHRLREPNGGYMRGGQNDLIGILRARRSNGSGPRHIRSLHIEGDVAADCLTYVQAFYPDLHGQYTENQLSRDCNKRKPFFHISWTSFPQSPVKLDGNDEEYARFGIARSMGAQIFQGDPKRFFGFGDVGARPFQSLVVPVWSLLVKFSATNPSDLTGIYPSARDEVKTGQVKFKVALDDDAQEINPLSIKFPWSVSLSDSYITKAIDAELFNAIQDNGLGPIRTDEEKRAQRASDPEIACVGPEGNVYGFSWVPTASLSPTTTLGAEVATPDLRLRNLSQEAVVQVDIHWHVPGTPVEQVLSGNDHFKKYGPKREGDMLGFLRGPSFLSADDSDTSVSYIGTAPVKITIPSGIWNSFQLKLIANTSRIDPRSERARGLTVPVKIPVVEIRVNYRQAGRSYRRDFTMNSEIEVLPDNAVAPGLNVSQVSPKDWSMDNLRAQMRFSCH